MSSVYDWSTTAASNSNSDGAIVWSDGQAPSSVDDSGRQVMGRVAEIVKDLGGALTAGGTANALTVTANSAFTTNVNGRFLALRIATTNTAAATLNVNGIGAKAIRKMLASGESALVGNELQATGIYLLMYSEALNSAAGGWLLLNPTINFSTFSGLILVPTNKSYKVVVKAPFGGTIAETVTICASGTATATFKINTTALGGTANAVSSSEQTQTQASANVFAAGDDIVITVSANSSCLDMSYTIKYTRA